MPTTTTGSDNIAILDSRLRADLCEGIFYIDVTPSTFIGSGASNVLGASVKITNPYGVVIKNYPTSGYDIYPPMTDIIEVDVPTQASNFQYGTYTVVVQITDADGDTYEISKPLKICAPDPLNKNRKYGSLSAELNGVCTAGKLFVNVDEVPVYNGKVVESQVNDFTLLYPTSSNGLDPIESTITAFSALLFEGEYRLTGTICALYNMGDNVYVNVSYKVKRYKTIRCLLDKACVAAALSSLDAQTRSDCSDAEKMITLKRVVDSLRLISTIDALINAGYDASDYISDLEDALGCVCTCNCADGTPIINQNPVNDFVIEGCGVEYEEIGLTKHYTINNYEYIVEVAANGGALTVTTPTLEDCTKTQTFTFNINVVYSQIASIAASEGQRSFWASIINHSWDGLNISCAGVSQELWNSYSYTQRTQAIINQLCVGGTCDAEIAADDVVNTAADVTVSWTNVEDVYEVAAYLDGELKGTVLFPGTSYKFLGAADGDNHIWTLVSKCSNGSKGSALSGDFTYSGCPLISVPSLSSNSVSGADCPYDLTALVETLPMGITAEWHTLNNTNTSSLVADPTAAIGGTYYVFAKDTNGCYSLGVNVILTCSEETNCSAPQNLSVETIDDGNRIRFQSAAFPPPSNSYTVKRRLKADPDVSGSYTTIGTPAWNATVSRWEIMDATAVDNTLYTYRAVSNCTSTSPYIDYDYANLDCPAITLTPAEETVDYEFTGVGGGVDKYEVSIYDEEGVTLIHTDTIVPAFTNPIEGTFIYLDADNTYKVRVKVFIGAYSVTCAFQTVETVGYNYTLSASYNYSIDTVTGTGVPSPAVPSTGANGTEYGQHTAMSGSYSIAITGSAVPGTAMQSFVNDVQQDCVDISAGAGTYSLDITADEADDVRITIVLGTC